ncbi:MAG: RES family NAD+ phosphorylase [Zavarzinella sp.]
MKQKAHPRYAEIKRWMLERISQQVSLEGEFFRTAGPSYTSAKQIVAGVGGLKSAGRWHPYGVLKIVYLSDEPETSLQEANEHFRYYQLPLKKGYPKVTVIVVVKLTQVLDLTDPTVSETLPIPLEQVMTEDWRAIVAQKAESAGQAIGRAAHQIGLQGLLVPSKPCPKSKNLLVFPKNLHSLLQIEVQNPEELELLGKNS